MVNAYRRISLFNHAIEGPNVPSRVYLNVHMVPDDTKQLMHIRIWRKGTMVHSLSLPLRGFGVRFSTLANTPGRQAHPGVSQSSSGLRPAESYALKWSMLLPGTSHLTDHSTDGTAHVS